MKWVRRDNDGLELVATRAVPLINFLTPVMLTLVLGGLTYALKQFVVPNEHVVTGWQFLGTLSMIVTGLGTFASAIFVAPTGWVLRKHLLMSHKPDDSNINFVEANPHHIILAYIFFKYEVLEVVEDRRLKS